MEYVLQVIGLPTGVLKHAGQFFKGFAEHVSDHFIPHARNNYHPHILGHRALALFSALLVSVKIFTIAVLAWGPIAPALSSAISVSNIINLTNQSRQQYNLTTLTENSQLDQAAQAKADDMLARGYFAHNTPDGRTPWSFITAAGYNYLMAGENLAVNFTEAEDVETAWMNSPGHRANILNKDFEQIGIGVSQGQYQGHNAIFVVQEFGTPAVQPVALSQTPTKVQASSVPVPAPAAASQPAQVAKVSGAQSASTPAKAQTQSLPPAQKQSTTQAPQAKSAPTNPTPTMSAPAAPILQQPANVSIADGQIKLDGNNIDVTAQVIGPAVKVLARFGDQAVMLAPQSDGSWAATVPATQLLPTTVSVNLLAQGMQGQISQLQLAEFTPNTLDNFSPLHLDPVPTVTMFGQTFDPRAFEQQFYLFFIAGLLASLVLAIGLKKHIQHLSLIVNSSFVLIFAALLFLGG